MRACALVTISLLLTTCTTQPAQTVPSVSASSPNAHDCVDNVAYENQAYARVSDRILRAVSGLRDRFLHFAEMDPNDRMESPIVTPERLWASHNYDRAVEWVQPEATQSSRPVKRSVRPSFKDPHGISFTVYFYTGPWTGTAAVFPMHIGDMNVHYFLRVENDQDRIAIAAEIDRIITDEANVWE